mmetsp:Transcript_47313/g.118150  ORF Transcript_47313/g.118150 Transcript_47313/m.118150 type:complete len:214 (-) Transcript_47313:16-657(-)
MKMQATHARTAREGREKTRRDDRSEKSRVVWYGEIPQYDGLPVKSAKCRRLPPVTVTVVLLVLLPPPPGHGGLPLLPLVHLPQQPVRVADRRPIGTHSLANVPRTRRGARRRVRHSRRRLRDVDTRKKLARLRRRKQRVQRWRRVLLVLGHRWEGGAALLLVVVRSSRVSRQPSPQPLVCFPLAIETEEKVEPQRHIDGAADRGRHRPPILPS